MYQTVIKTEGMACGMCEAHVNDAVRAVMKVKRVRSSYKKGETEILTTEPPNEALLRAAIEKTGYRVLSVASRPYEKKRLFGLFG